MGRRRRRWREWRYAWWTGIAALLIVAVLLRSWRVGLLALLVWCLYEFALIPTLCRVMTREGFSCHEPIRGRLFACRPEHQRVKNDGLWRLVGMSNPFHRRVTGDPNRDTGVVVYSPTTRAHLAQNDRTILMLAGVGAFISLVGAIWGLT